ncbi:MAG TPA: hypothetical protein VHZ98_16510, partial [Galbitalea sp.]|nr:hypothetical protein [Galbitalea sp.]
TAEGLDVKPIQLSIMDTLERSYVTVELNFSQWAERWRADGNDERAVQTLQERWATIPALAEAMTHILAGEGARRSLPLAKFDEGSQRKATDALRAFTSTV